MKNFSPEDLLGYVLGALDADQHDDLQTKLDQDPKLEERLLEIKTSLAPLELLTEPTCSRPGLARRTCELVASRDHGNELGSKGGSRFRPVAVESRLAGASWSKSDFLVAIASIGILASLLFPVISYTRYQSRIVDCGNNLRSIGFALASYSESNQGNFVEIPRGGPLAFSGSFALVLKDGRFVDDDRVFSCAAVLRDEPLEIPSCEQISQCSAGPKYDRLRRNSSGDYGYSLGYVENDRYCSPRNLGNKNRILCADKPSSKLIGGPSDNHGGKGQNCLFEDFSVDYVVGCSSGDDCIYVNELNIVGPGVSSRDSVIGPGHLAPMQSSQPTEFPISE